MSYVSQTCANHRTHGSGTFSQQKSVEIPQMSGTNQVLEVQLCPTRLLSGEVTKIFQGKKNTSIT